ncbi:cytoskeletal protein binding protein [Lambiella insularis]|nr:cytoskeletal protein binding protein [Lambiella insularis]
MVFLSICTALYDYVPQGDGELAIHEGELVYILEKSLEDDWWKGKKKAPGQEDEEPVGLIPNNYVEEAEPTHHAKALYDYSRQTDEELSFSEDAALEVYDTSDPDWTLVGLNGEYGFAPSNYIEIINGVAERPSPKATVSPRLPEQDTERDLPPTPTSPDSPQNPAAALAGIIHKQAIDASSSAQRPLSSTLSPSANSQYTPDASDEEPTPPSLPQRPVSQQIAPSAAQKDLLQSPKSPGVVASPPYDRALNYEGEDHSTQGSFHLYNINEIVSAMGKQKKMPTTLGINLATGVIMISPERTRDGPQQEWTAEKLTHYSIEGKHIFLELVRPSKSLDLHAGAKDTAQEIVAALSELAGASKAEGLREVIAAVSGVKSQRNGHMLYDFVAQGDDEVTVGVGDEVIILDDSTEEWWHVRRLKNGKEGVVPGSYVEATGFTLPKPPSSSGLNAGRSTIEQNRIEEERQTREAVQNSKHNGDAESKGSEVGPGVKLPTRGSSLIGGKDNSNQSPQQEKRDSRSGAKSSTSTVSKSKPNVTKTRTWTDRSGSFKVEAEFIGLKDGKIHLHKLNGVKIAVPVVKMAVEDLEYVEAVTGVSLDEDKPLSDIKRRSQKGGQDKERNKAKSLPSSGPNIATLRAVQQSKPPEYDWFDFFLKCGVSPYHCERYSSNFNRDSMDESVLPDITPPVMRTLGLKEGDILKVMKYLDNKYGRTNAKSRLRNVSFGGEEYFGHEEGDGPVTSPGGGLFSGPGGALKNNTRKGRPAPAVQTNDTVDPEAFKQKSDTSSPGTDSKDKRTNPPASVSAPSKKSSGGFDDDAWDVKPTKQPGPASPSIVAASAPAAHAPGPTATPGAPFSQTLTGSMADLSLLSQPLQPVIAHSTSPVLPAQNQTQNFSESQQQVPSQPQAVLQQPPFQYQPQPQPLHNMPYQQLQQQSTGASPAYFTSLVPQMNGTQQQQQQSYGGQVPAGQNFISQTTGMVQPQGSTSQLPSMQTMNAQSTNHSQTGFQLNAAPRQRPQAPQFNQQGALMPPPPPRPLSAPQNVSQQNNFGPPPLQPQLTGIPSQAGSQHQFASPGPSLNDLNKMRLQQQFNLQQQLQPQSTAFDPQTQSLNHYSNGFTQQPGVYRQQQQQQQQQQQPQLQPQLTGVQPSPLYLNGQQTGSLFANPRSPPLGSLPPQSANITGFAPSIYNPIMAQQTGSVNTVLPPALQPQQTGINGLNRPGYNHSQTQASIPLVPSTSQQQIPAALQLQKTGPAPPVRFGVAPEAKKLMPQATGRRANLSHASTFTLWINVSAE